MEILDRLEAYWGSVGLGQATRSPVVATEQDILDFEERTGSQLPTDLRAYFLCLNGTNGEGDSQLFRFWPIREMRRVDFANFNLPQAESYFFFADFMIESWYYAIYLGDDLSLQNHVILPDFPNKPVIASSFTAFLELYLKDDPALYGP